jgi:hypothetical protein
LPVFLFLADSSHLSACFLISFFFTIIVFRVDGGRPSHLATSILFSDGFVSTSFMMYSLFLSPNVFHGKRHVGIKFYEKMMIWSAVVDQTHMMNCILSYMNAHTEMSHTNIQAGFPCWPMLSLSLIPSSPLFGR